VRALAVADVLPGPSDITTAFGASKVHARRVQGANLWPVFSVDAEHVHLITVKDAPPVPVDD
jgi:hypothetical protein